MFSQELQNALDAMRQINNATDMSVLASEFNRHINYIGKQKAVGIKLGDTITWEYGGIQKQGVIKKIKPQDCRSCTGKRWHVWCYTY